MPQVLSQQGAADFFAVARMHNPQVVVLRGDQSLLTVQQGLTVLGAPVGHPDYVKAFMFQKGVEHDQLFEIIPHVPDVQAAWLLLAVLRIHQSELFLEDSGSRSSHSSLLQDTTSRSSSASAKCSRQTRCIHNTTQPPTMPLTLGGLGLGNAQRTRDAAHWGS